MAKPTIVTRAGKGSALTWTEGDANLTNLRDATIGITDGTTSGTLDLNDTLTFTAGTNVTLSYNATSKALTITAAGGSGITDVVQDTTPQLGGNLDVNGNSIVSASNGNIAITPNGTGSIVLDGLNWPQADGTNGQVLQTNGSGQLSWATAGGVPTQVDFTATPASTDVYFVTTSAAGAGAKNLYAVNNGGLKFNTGTGQITTDVNLTLNGSNLMVRLGGNVRLYDNDDSNAAILAGPASLTANTLFRLPDTNGSSGQVLQTDGSGNTSWVTSSGGATNLDGLSDVVITTPVSGHVLRHNGTNFVNVAETTLSVSSASTATTATTATGATNINISTTTGNSNDTTLYPVMVGANATGNQLPHIDGAGLAFNATTNALTLGSTGTTNTASVVLWNNSDATTTLTAGAGGSNITLTLPTATGTLLNSNGTLTGVFNGSTATASSTITANSTTANSPKLTIGTGSLSSTAWTTSGIGLRVSAATYTDTSSLAGTVANSHVHAIAAPTMASTNAITVTDAGTLYISGAPTAGTNTTITNGWALLANGRIKATAIDNTPIGSTTASTGAFTTISGTTTGTNGVLNLTYNPATASGAAIQATGKDSQGGVGYFDFLKVTNSTAGATNANKTFRLNSTGALEIVNSGYTATILSLTDAGALSVPSATISSGALTINAANELRLADSDSSNYVGFKSPATVTTNRIWTLPAADGTSGQVLSTNGSGTLSWATAGGGGGMTIASLRLSGWLGQLITTNNYRVTLTETLDTSSIVSLPTAYTFRLGAGSYTISTNFSATRNTADGNDTNFVLYDETAGAAVETIGKMPSTTGTLHTITGSTAFTITGNTDYSIRINAVSYITISPQTGSYLSIFKHA